MESGNEARKHAEPHSIAISEGLLPIVSVIQIRCSCSELFDAFVCSDTIFHTSSCQGREAFLEYSRITTYMYRLESYQDLDSDAEESEVHIQCTLTRSCEQRFSQ